MKTSTTQPTMQQLKAAAFAGAGYAGLTPAQAYHAAHHPELQQWISSGDTDPQAEPWISLEEITRQLVDLQIKKAPTLAHGIIRAAGEVSTPAFIRQELVQDIFCALADFSPNLNGTELKELAQTMNIPTNQLLKGLDQQISRGTRQPLQHSEQCS